MRTPGVRRKKSTAVVTRYHILLDITENILKDMLEFIVQVSEKDEYRIDEDCLGTKRFNIMLKTPRDGQDGNICIDEICQPERSEYDNNDFNRYVGELIHIALLFPVVVKLGKDDCETIRDKSP